MACRCFWIKTDFALSYLDAHLRVFVHSRCAVCLLRDDCVSFIKNYSFCCCINFVLYQWYDTRHTPSVVHPLPPSAQSWVMVCRGVHAASSRGRQRCSGRWLDTLISISNLSHTGRLQTSAKHLWHLQTQCGHRLLLFSATSLTEVHAGIKL